MMRRAWSWAWPKGMRRNEATFLGLIYGACAMMVLSAITAAIAAYV